MKKAYEKRIIIYDFKTEKQAMNWCVKKVKELNAKGYQVLPEETDVYDNGSDTYKYSAKISYQIDYLKFN